MVAKRRGSKHAVRREQAGLSLHAVSATRKRGLMAGTVHRRLLASARMLVAEMEWHRVPGRLLLVALQACGRLQEALQRHQLM